MRHFTLFICLLLVIGSAQAQTFNLDKVTKAELEEKVHPKDTAAAAAYLFRTCKMKFDYNAERGFFYVAEYTIKLKVYKKEGLNWGSIKIPYYVGYKELEKDRLEIKRAFTYNLDNGKVVKERVTSDGKLLEKENSKWETRIVTFPNVKPGSIIELQYIIKSDDIASIDLFRMQSEIPVNEAFLQTAIPAFYVYKVIKSGYLDMAINQKVEPGFINFSAKNGSYGMSSDQSLTFNNVVSTFYMESIPALKEEKYSAMKKDYFSAVSLELERTQFPNEEPKQIAGTWEDVSKTIYEDKAFGKELLKGDYYLTDLKNITANESDSYKRMTAIFHWVKQRMGWNNYRGIFASQPLEEAYQKRQGSVADINLILVSMLKMSALEAYPVLLSTRDNGVPNFPNISKFNYVIAAVKLNDKVYLLDATHKAGNTQMLPLRALNEIGRLVRYDGTSEEIDLMPKTTSLENYTILAKLSPSGSIEGIAKNTFTEYEAADILAEMNGKNLEQMAEWREKIFESLTISNYKVFEKEDGVAQEEFSFSSNGYVESIGVKLLIDPLLFQTHSRNPFTAEERLYPINFSYPNRLKTTLILTIPDGFVVESYPKEGSFSLPEGKASYKFKASLAENTLTLTATMDINQAEFPAEAYFSLKEFFKLATAKETEKIVLVKR